MTDVEIVAVGGYNEMGRNMTAVVYGEDIVILDMGIRLDRVQIHEDAEIDRMHSLELIEMGAIPDDTIMRDINGTVRAIVCTHGHLDHIGAIPKLAHRYNAPIISTPYTTALIRQQIEEERKFKVNNPLVTLRPGNIYEITDEKQRATAMSVYTSMGSVAGIFGNAFGGLLIEAFSIKIYFLIIGILSAIVTVLFVRKKDQELLVR